MTSENFNIFLIYIATTSTYTMGHTACGTWTWLNEEIKHVLPPTEERDVQWNDSVIEELHNA